MKLELKQKSIAKFKELSKITLLSISSLLIINSAKAQNQNNNKAYLELEVKKQNAETNRQKAILKRDNWLAKQKELQQQLGEKANTTKILLDKRILLNEEAKATLEKQRKIAEANRQRANKIRAEQLIFRKDIRKEYKVLFDNAKEIRTEALAKGNLKLRNQNLELRKQKLEAQKEVFEKAKLFREKSLAELKEKRATIRNNEF